MLELCGGEFDKVGRYKSVEPMSLKEDPQIFSLGVSLFQTPVVLPSHAGVVFPVSR